VKVAGKVLGVVGMNLHTLKTIKVVLVFNQMLFFMDLPHRLKIALVFCEKFKVASS
jgi:hypothetical protein